MLGFIWGWDFKVNWFDSYPQPQWTHTVEGIAIYTYTQRPTEGVTDMPRESGHTEKAVPGL